MPNKKCQSCGNATPEDEYLVCSAPYTAMSVGRCPSCFANDIYPYQDLADACWSVGGFDLCADWFQGLIISNLIFYNKTKKDFIKEVKEIDYGIELQEPSN